MAQLTLATAVYQDGVLKLQGPLPGFVDGDRVEIAVVRVAPIDRDAPEEVARRERALKAFDEQTAALERELRNIVENDRYPFSPRVRTCAKSCK